MCNTSILTVSILTKKFVKLGRIPLVRLHDINRFFTWLLELAISFGLTYQFLLHFHVLLSFAPPSIRWNLLIQRELSLESDVFLDSFEEISGKIQSFSQYDLGFVHLTLFNAPLCPIAVQLSSRVHTVRITCSLNIPCKRLLAAHACRFKTYPRLLVFTIKFDILVTLAACPTVIKLCFLGCHSQFLLLIDVGHVESLDLV